MKIAIINGRVIDAASQFDQTTDVIIDNGKIIHVGSAEKLTPDKTIDASGQWVIPGLVDICARPQMQHPHGITLQPEAMAALKRGITSLCIPPDGDPIVDTSANVLRLMQQGHNALPHLYPIGALTVGLNGELIADITALYQVGCIAFSNAQKPIIDLRILRYAYEYAASFDLTVVIQPQDPWLARGGIAHEGVIASRLGLAGIPGSAETIALAEHLLLIEQTGVKAHFTSLSTHNAVQQIKQAKNQGLRVSADTAMHLLHLTEEDIAGFDANCHLYPPLRSQHDRDGLLNGVAENIIDAICSDHRPLDSIAKLAPFGDTLPGLSAIDTFLSLGLKLVSLQKISLMNLIGAITSRPAQIFNLPAGRLQIGSPADICLIDPNKVWSVEEKTLFSTGKNTPFKSQDLTGVVTHTVLNGILVHEP